MPRAGGGPDACMGWGQVWFSLSGWTNWHIGQKILLEINGVQLSKNGE